MLDEVATCFTLLGWLAFCLTGLGIGYSVACVVAFLLFFARRSSEQVDRVEGVTLLKPLCGIEPKLEQNLRTFFEQDHGGPIQIVCGYAMPDDGAASALASLASLFPMADFTAVVSDERHGPNAKVSNLVNLYAKARHPIVILSDSDMAVRPEYLGHVLRALEKKDVGAVSLLYCGRGDAGFWSILSAAGISYQFLPNAVFGVWSRLASPCMGSTIALRRDVLERIGHLRSFAGHLADDYAIGEAIRRDGLTVDVPPHLITHACSQTSFRQLWRQEVRWGATIKGVVPFGYLGSIVTNPLPLAVLGTLATGRYAFGCGLAAASLCIRALQVVLVDHRVGTSTAPIWLLPLRDCLSFGVFIASLCARRVDWRGQQHLIQPRGRLAPEQESLA